MHFPSAVPTPVVPTTPQNNAAGDITGKFDPTALERGAKALKELDSSQNAAKAFEVIRLQELTKQKELQSNIEQTQTVRAQASAQRAQVEGEEKRKTLQEQSEQERRTAQYKAQLESELYQKKLQDQQKQNDQWLQQQHEQFLKQEQMRQQNDERIESNRRKTLLEQAKLQREAEIARAHAETDGRIKQERDNVDVHLRTMRAKLSEERKTKLDSINATLSSLGSGFNALLADKPRLYALVGGLSAVAIGVYSARAGARVAGNLIEKRLGRPSLVRESSRSTWRNTLCPQVIRNLFQKKSGGNIMEKIVLEEELSERLTWTTNALVNAKKNGTAFQHLMLYGPPGTGKTLFARTLAKQSGLDYAIMTGGDIGPLGRDAVDELNKLFAWANTSKKGLILFIDEADAFLRQGRMTGDHGSMSEDARNVLSAFLHHTGTENDKFMVILATNVREVMDKAVLDRVDEHFQFPLPGFEQRVQMLNMFMDEHIYAPTKLGKVISVDEAINEDYIKSIAQKTEGFSGRQLSKLVLAYQAAVFGSGTNTLTIGMANTVLDWKLNHFTEDVDTILRKKE